MIAFVVVVLQAHAAFFYRSLLWPRRIGDDLTVWVPFVDFSGTCVALATA